MKAYLAICDLCRTGEGNIRLAKIEYFGLHNAIFHACATHSKDVKKANLDIIQEFDYPGGAKESDLED